MRKSDGAFAVFFAMLILIAVCVNGVKLLASIPPEAEWPVDDEYIAKFVEYMEQFGLQRTTTTHEVFFTSVEGGYSEDRVFHGVAFYSYDKPYEFFLL